MYRIKKHKRYREAQSRATSFSEFVLQKIQTILINTEETQYSKTAYNFIPRQMK